MLAFVALAALSLHIAPASPRPTVQQAMKGSAVETLALSTELHKALGSSDRRCIFVLFGKRQCGACRALLPRIKQVASKRQATSRFLHIDLCRTTKDAFDTHNISIVPTLAVFVTRAVRRWMRCAPPDSTLLH